MPERDPHVPVVLTRPQPFEPLPHTADAAVLVRGDSAVETLGRLVLAYTELVTAGTAVEPTGETPLVVRGGTTLAQIGVDTLRAVHTLLTTQQLVPVAVAVHELSEEAGARLSVTHGRFDPAACQEGLDIKAVTYHACLFAPAPEGGFVARVVLDI